MLQIGDTAPDFEAQTTEGKIGSTTGSAIPGRSCSRIPKDFTPVCTTELGYMARIKPEFDKRGVKIIGLSVDPVENHAKWANDIKETQGFAPNYPMIGDTDLSISKAWGMLAASTTGDAVQTHRHGQPDGAQRVRHRARQEDQAAAGLPDDHRPEFRRGAARDRLAPAHRQAQGRDTGELEERRGRDHRGLGDRTTTPRRPIRTAGSRRSLTSASCRSPAADGIPSANGYCRTTKRAALDGAALLRLRQPSMRDRRSDTEYRRRQARRRAWSIRGRDRRPDILSSPSPPEAARHRASRCRSKHLGRSKDTGS